MWAIVVTTVCMIGVIVAMTVKPPMDQRGSHPKDRSATTHVHNWTGYFFLNQELYIKNTHSGTKSLNITAGWSNWSWCTTVSLVIRCWIRLIIARMYIKCHCIRERNNNIFSRRILESRTAKPSNFKEPICDFSRVWSHSWVILSIVILILTSE
jgi:hypothetical protein